MYYEYCVFLISRTYFRTPVGKGQDTVLVSDPRLFNHVLANDGKYPITSGFDTLANIRLNELKHRLIEIEIVPNHSYYLELAMLLHSFFFNA